MVLVSFGSILLRFGGRAFVLHDDGSDGLLSTCWDCRLVMRSFALAAVAAAANAADSGR
jgi:hypothetical protein